MKLRLLLITLISGYFACAQSIFENPITGTNPSTSNPYTIGQTFDSNITVSGISRGSGINAASANDRYSANNWNSGSLNTAKYFEFTLTPNSGYEINFISFVYIGQASGTGATNFAFRSSLDGYTANIGSPNVSGTISLAAGTFQNIASPITFRFYGWGASSATGTFSINDFVFNGTVVPTCTPPVDPSGTISVISGCGSSNLTYSLPSATAYWQATANGMDTNFPTTSSYNVSTSGTYYVRTFDGTCWSTNSISSMVTVSNPVNINTQPTDQFATTGLGATFSVVANNASSYQWQVSTDGGGSWVNVGTNSSSYTTPSATLAMNGNQYQVIISGTSPCTSITSDLATLFVTNGTTFRPGELIFTGFDGQINGSGANDEYLIATLVDIVPGTVFSIVNSRYEAGALAGVRTDKWGGGGDDPSEAPYEVVITYNGATSIPAGSVLQIITNNSPIWFGSISVITGTTSTNRTSDFSGSIIGGTPNISTSSPDQMYLIQGSFVSDGTIDLNEANYYLTGKLLHGLTNRAAWVPLANACSGSSSTSSSNPRESRLPSALTCFNVESVDLNAVSGYYENDKEHGIASLNQIINAVADVSNNWTLGTGRYTLNPSSNLTTSAGKTFQIGASNPAGQWVGGIDTNWFNCANWEGLAVPDSNTDVIIDASALNVAQIDYLSIYSDDYNDLAVSKNISILGSKLEILGNSNNELEVFGDLLIDSSGILDMDDSNSATIDGQIYLNGNWTNNRDESAFEEGNGTVHFKGSNTQIINSVLPEGTEIFNHVVIDNDFTTALSNNLISKGNLIVTPSHNLVVSTQDYVQIENDLTVNGALNVLNNGSLIQVNDLGINTGNISYERSALMRKMDYVYWSSPVSNFNVNNISITTPTSLIFNWNPTIANSNSGIGNWINASGNTMSAGLGYIVRGPIAFTNSFQTFTATFNNGIPHNGVINVPVSRGTYTGADYLGINGMTITKFDDNLNLIGNPYPSSINALDFLNLNANIEGAVRIWTHGTLPSSSIPDPFYGDFGSNYTINDYIVHNGLGTISGPGGFNGLIAGAQSFFVIMNDGAATTENVVFNNSLRSRTYDNSQFFKTSNHEKLLNRSEAENEKHRIWLDLIDADNESVRTLIGYVSGATILKDRMFDAIAIESTTATIYSLINQDRMCIQGRGLPFEDGDRVPLGVKIIKAGTNAIAIHAIDGLFDNQDIFLEDLYLNVTHDLKSSPYSFHSTLGNFNDRFILKYKQNNLSNDNFDIDENEIIVISEEDIQIKSLKDKIDSVVIYDVLGRKVYDNKNVNNEILIIDSLMKNHVALIIQVKINNNNSQVIKKIIH